uniref:Glycoside hydrolase family 76 protein n=1 Tax=Moniliophthora roreri TaxID=221103 RepID=A0A0W0EYJ6_MONRR
MQAWPTDSLKKDFAEEFVRILLPVFRLSLIVLSCYRQLDTELVYGYVAARVYNIYNDAEFAQYAERVWNSGKRYTLSNNDISSRRSPVKNASLVLQSECAGESLAGGTFWRKDVNEGLISSAATEFVLPTDLGAHGRSNQQQHIRYVQAALESARFMQHQLYDSSNNVRMWIDAYHCAPRDGPRPVDAGLMIEGLAVLASVTGEETIKKQLQDTILAATTNQAWQGADGIMKEGYFREAFVRGLSVAYSRSLIQPYHRQYIADYIGAQYNAVLKNARMGASNTYSGVWNGSTSADAQVTGETQTGAITVLLGAVPLPQNSQNSTSDIPPKDTAKKPNTAAIVGGVIGGLGLLTLIISVLLWMWRRRARAAEGRTFQTSTGNPEAQNVGLTVPPIHEKSRLPLQQSSPPQQANPRTTKNTRMPTRNNTGSAEDNFGNISTDVLVRALNNRLQLQQWRPDERPPGYTETSGAIS